MSNWSPTIIANYVISRTECGAYNNSLLTICLDQSNLSGKHPQFLEIDKSLDLCLVAIKKEGEILLDDREEGNEWGGRAALELSVLSHIVKWIHEPSQVLWSVWGLNVWSVWGLNVWSVWGLNVRSVWGLNVWSLWGLNVWSVWGLNVWSVWGLNVWSVWGLNEWRD